MSLVITPLGLLHGAKVAFSKDKICGWSHGSKVSEKIETELVGKSDEMSSAANL